MNWQQRTGRLIRSILIVSTIILSGSTTAHAAQPSSQQSTKIQATLDQNHANAVVLVGDSANNPQVFIANHGRHAFALNAHQFFPIASFQKSVTGVAVQQLINEHQLKLHQKIHHYFPGMRQTRHITIQELMTHTSGLVDVRQIANKPIKTQKQNVEFIEHNYRRISKPGQWHYANINYGLLAVIVSRGSLENYQEYIKEHILAPNHIRGMLFFNQVNTVKKMRRIALSPTSIVRRDNPWRFLQLEMSAEFGAGQLLATPTSYWQFVQKAILGDHHILKVYRDQSRRPRAHYYAGFYLSPNELHANGAFKGYACTVFVNLKNRRTIMIFTNNLGLSRCRQVAQRLKAIYL